MYPNLPNASLSRASYCELYHMLSPYNCPVAQMMLSITACQGALLSHVSGSWDCVHNTFYAQHLLSAISTLLTEYLTGDLQNCRSYSGSKKVSSCKISAESS